MTKRIKSTLPDEVRIDPHAKHYIVLPANVSDKEAALVTWERKSHPDDIPQVMDGAKLIRQGTYFGEWVDKSEIVKAKYELAKAEEALKREHLRMAKKVAEREVSKSNQAKIARDEALAEVTKYPFAIGRRSVTRKHGCQ